jgi:hypothetical protein
MHSFNETLDRYRALLVAQQHGVLQLPNDNLDTGGLTEPAVYRLTDEAYATLLDMTSGKSISDALRRDILASYANLENGFATKKDPQAWEKVLTELDSLRSMPASVPKNHQGTTWLQGARRLRESESGNTPIRKPALALPAV